ncbi:non-homologous end joining protein Ku [Streptomyces sp. KR80]|uniref:non-homologous end joining protein Ku n=1 Tax=Streptomyces sp. KR80 TaxID=3457426 RepID=UPI003FD41FEB
MARAIWSGALSFGLVAMPVQLFTATESHTIRFNQLQRGTSDRVRNKRVNERTGKEVPLEEIVKGFDMGDEYVVVEPEELDEIAPGRSKGLEITGFVDLEQVNPIFFDRTYYLAPKGKEYGKVYALLLEALSRSNKAGIATFVMRNREYLVAVKAEGDVLSIHTLHWADEVRDPHREIGSLPEQTQVSDKELQTAVQLVEALSMDWDPEEYHDTYQERVMQLVEAKRTGETFEKGEPPPSSTNVIDLMDALQASVDKARGGKEAGAKKEKKEKAGAERKPTQLTEAAEKRRGARTTKKTEKKPSKAAELEGLSKTELYQRASEAGIPGRSSMSRDELIKALTAKPARRKAHAS